MKHHAISTYEKLIDLCDDNELLAEELASLMAELDSTNDLHSAFSKIFSKLIDKKCISTCTVTDIFKRSKNSHVREIAIKYFEGLGVECPVDIAVQCLKEMRSQLINFDHDAFSAIYNEPPSLSIDYTILPRYCHFLKLCDQNVIAKEIEYLIDLMLDLPVNLDEICYVYKTIIQNFKGDDLLKVSRILRDCLIKDDKVSLPFLHIYCSLLSELPAKEIEETANHLRSLSGSKWQLLGKGTEDSAITDWYYRMIEELPRKRIIDELDYLERKFYNKSHIYRTAAAKCYISLCEGMLDFLSQKLQIAAYMFRNLFKEQSSEIVIWALKNYQHISSQLSFEELVSGGVAVSLRDLFVHESSNVATGAMETYRNIMGQLSIDDVVECAKVLRCVMKNEGNQSFVTAYRMYLDLVERLPSDELAEGLLHWIKFFDYRRLATYNDFIKILEHQELSDLVKKASNLREMFNHNCEVIRIVSMRIYASLKNYLHGDELTRCAQELRLLLQSEGRPNLTINDLCYGWESIDGRAFKEIDFNDKEWEEIKSRYIKEFGCDNSRIVALYLYSYLSDKFDKHELLSAIESFRPLFNDDDIGIRNNIVDLYVQILKRVDHDDVVRESRLLREMLCNVNLMYHVRKYAKDVYVKVVDRFTPDEINFERDMLKSISNDKDKYKELLNEALHKIEERISR